MSADQCCTLRLIDETHHQIGMAVNIFTENAESLPHVAAAGDIIQLCNVTVESVFNRLSVVFWTYLPFYIHICIP